MADKETAVETASEEKSLAQRGNDLAQSIIKTLDLPTSISEAVDEKVKKEEEKDDESKESPEDGDSASQPEEEPSQEQEDSKDEENILDPVQKRIDELTREKKQLEARLKKLEATQAKKSDEVDPDLDKLQKMSVEELKEVRKKVLRAQRTADEAQLDQLFDLEEKIVKTIEDAPRRFQSNQLERFQEAVSSTSDLSEKELQVVFGHAKNIFERTPSFQKSVDGQAEAWNLAVDHYREMNKLTVGKSKVNELERKVNELKKKTSLDTAVQKGNSKISDEAKLFNRAKLGSESDKEAFIRKRLNTDALVPEEFRRS